MGSVTVTKSENGNYNFNVSLGGRIVNALANIAIGVLNLFLPEKYERDYYGKYTFGDNSKTASGWQKYAEEAFKQNKSKGCQD
jgi:hypothetical protein